MNTSNKNQLNRNQVSFATLLLLRSRRPKRLQSEQATRDEQSGPAGQSLVQTLQCGQPARRVERGFAESTGNQIAETGESLRVNQGPIGQPIALFMTKKQPRRI